MAIGPWKQLLKKAMNSRLPAKHHGMVSSTIPQTGLHFAYKVMEGCPTIGNITIKATGLGLVKVNDKTLEFTFEPTK